VRRGVLAPLLGALFLACAHAEPEPTNLSASAKEGHRLYLAKCQMCHELVEPTEFTRAQWPQKFPVFAKRAKLSPGEYQDILAYLEETGRP
jgi:cytochrome c5